MADFSDSLKSAIRSAVCTYTRRAANGVSWLKNTLSLDDGYPIGPTQGWRGLLCDDPYVDESENEYPYLGGQCSNVRYVWDVTYERVTNPPGCSVSLSDDSGTLADSNFEIWGPITNVELHSLVTNDPCGIDFYTQIRISCHDRFGNPVTYDSLIFGSRRIVKITSLVFSRFDGQPDTCGNPNPSIPEFPDTGDTINFDFSYVDESNNVVNRNVNLTLFAPIVGSFNNVFAPIRVELPDFVLDGTIQITPTVEINLGPADRDKGPGSPEGPPLPPPEPEDDPPDNDDDSDRVIIGVVVRAETDGQERATEIYQANSPTIFAPRLGNVNFVVVHGGVSSYTADIPIKNRNQYIPCPEPRGAVGVRITPESGVTITRRLIRGKPLT